jgi:REP element-mobilizing transposase RayT
MPNTYTQIYIQYVFAVQNRASLINEKWQTQLYKYISGITEKQDHKLFAINGMPDHVHVLISMNPKQAPSDLMYHIKRSSSLWINDNKLVAGKFSWQEGFGAFSYGKSQITDIARYIENQQQHHKKRSFIEEYIELLNAFGIEYDERYIYKPIE